MKKTNLERKKKKSMEAAAIVVREVWAKNVAAELNLIQSHLQDFPYISMDTEFPGTVFTPTDKKLIRHLKPSELYALMKRNVDALCLIQLGLTLSNAAGNVAGVWQFNFSDFDADSQPHNKDSISLLQRQGIDFSENRRAGIHSAVFALLFKLSGLCLRAVRGRDLAWVTFHGVYDFGFLIKILTGRQLPDDLGGFTALLWHYFGPGVYDLKPVARELGLHGGLESIAKRVAVERAVGRSHQAGSDSLLTMRVLEELIRRYGEAKILGLNYNLFGLTPIP